MVDLYKRLGLSPQATPTQIEEACQACNDNSVKEAGMHILIDRERRKQYDQIHGQVSRIAQLRANLAMDDPQGWLESHSDFRQKQTVEGSILDRLSQTRTLKKRTFRMKHWKLMVGMAWISVFSIIVGIVAATMSTPHHDDSYAPALKLPASALLTQPLPLSNATLTVTASTTVAHCYIKVVSSETRRVVSVIFLRSGDTVKAGLPSGEYEVILAAGDAWYGEKVLFGDTTYFRKLESPVALQPDSSVTLAINEHTRLLKLAPNAF